MEYASVLVNSLPVAECEKTVKSACRRLLAWLTGMENWSQSPAGEIVSAVMPFDDSQSLTSWTDSGDGATNFSTYKIQRV